MLRQSKALLHAPGSEESNQVRRLASHATKALKRKEGGKRSLQNDGPEFRSFGVKTRLERDEIQKFDC